MIPTLPIALAIATLVPAFVLWFIKTQDLYGSSGFRTVLLCFGWGVAALVIALLGVSKAAFAIPSVNNDVYVRFIAPIAEEILKSLILIYLVRRPNFTYFVDGAVYGFAAGMGFAIVENWSYVFQFNGSLGIAIGRVLSTNLMHASASGLVGIALGYARFQRFRGRAALLVIGWALAMALHVGFNNLVALNRSALLVVYAVSVGFIGAGVIFGMIKRGLVEQRGWISEELAEADSRVTRGEREYVEQLRDLQTILAPIKERFGEDKAKGCEQFIRLQAQLGIKRRAYEKNPNDAEKAAIKAEIDQISGEMDRVRRSVGVYCMMFVRVVYTPEVVSLWAGAIDDAIEVQKAARPATGGTNVWASLGERATKAAAPASPGTDGEG